MHILETNHDKKIIKNAAFFMIPPVGLTNLSPIHANNSHGWATKKNMVVAIMETQRAKKRERFALDYRAVLGE